MNGEPEIRVLDDPDATSRAAAEAIAAGLSAAVDERGVAHWVTTGGSGPLGIYRELARAPLRDAVPWKQVHVWWTDDRFVPRDHPLSNVLPFDQVLLSTSARAGLSGSGADAAQVDLGIEPGAPVPVGNVHVVPTTAAIGRGMGAGSAAMEYEAELRAAGLEVAESGFPIFDVMLLGIGGDGHLLSVFPGSPVFDGSAWVTAVPAPQHIEPHVERVTLHPRVIEAARHPIVVVQGADKAAILSTVLGPERDERRWPSQVARRAGATWFLDRAAASDLPDPLRG